MTDIDQRKASRLLPLSALLAAHGLSLLGNAVTMIVVPLYVLELTGSVVATGVAGVFATVPMIVGGALGGVLVDRIGFRRAAIAADVASGVTVAAIPLLAATIGLPFWALLALVFLSGLLDTPGNTAKSSLVPDLAEAAGVALTRASGAAGAVSRTATMLGASLAAVAVVLLGPLNALLLDAATFALSALLLAFFVPAGATGHTEQRSEGFWHEFAGGVRHLARTPVTRNLVLLIVVTNCLDAAGMLVIHPVYARAVSPDGEFLGVMIAFFAGGALTGSALFAWFGHRLPRRAMLVACFVLAGPPPYLAIALDLPLPAVLLVFALSGLAAGSINPLVYTVLYEQVPRAMRARVFGALTTGATAAMPLGSLLAGVAVDGLGFLASVLGIAAIYTAATLAPLVGRSWRGLNAA
ncbi:MAG: MFS transporter [Salinibacterium sp.]|nr:MFS transporter [Salinibacterium sp.]MBF0673278.1 MFS transporter [Salinibacterium sp.]